MQNNFLDFLHKKLTDRVKLHGNHYTTFGIFGIIYFIIPYFIWSHISDIKFETLILRLIACFLCFYLVILHQTKSWWSQHKLKKYTLQNINKESLTSNDKSNYLNNQINSGILPIYWLITVCYCLPTMSTYHLFADSFDTTWVVTFSLSVLTLVILVDWISFIILLILGSVIGYLLFLITASNTAIEYEQINFQLVIYINVFSIVIGAFFLYQKELMYKQVNDANEKLRRLNTNLDKKVLQRTNELKKALEYKTEFLNNISHEIRTPLHGILSVVSSLSENWKKYSDLEKANLVKVISESGDKLMKLVSNLLDLSKFEAGKMLYKFNNVNFISIVNNALSQLKPLIIDKDREIIFHNPLNTEDYVIYCDEVRIEQVILNFISNGLKYSKHDIEIYISFANVSGDKVEKDKATHLKLSVKDYGIGVPSQEMREIFYPFAQSSRTNSGTQGTGLGLSLSTQIIEAHKGKIWVDNNENEQGATFSFAIPINISDKNNKKNNSKNNLDLKIDSNSKILFVDDEEFCRVAGKVILESLDFNVDIAESGKDALNYIEKNKYDLIFLDLMIPDISGTEVLKHIKKSTLNSKAAVIVQSGASDDREISKALSLGANNYVTKPYNKKDILNIINQL